MQKAFNSPFAPFVPVGTRVTQEGLDFRRYCHCIVRWNLSTRPERSRAAREPDYAPPGGSVRKNVAVRLNFAFGDANHVDPLGHRVRVVLGQPDSAELADWLEARCETTEDVVKT